MRLVNCNHIKTFLVCLLVFKSISQISDSLDNIFWSCRILQSLGNQCRHCISTRKERTLEILIIIAPAKAKVNVSLKLCSADASQRTTTCFTLTSMNIDDTRLKEETSRILFVRKETLDPSPSPSFLYQIIIIFLQCKLFPLTFSSFGIFAFLGLMFSGGTWKIIFLLDRGKQLVMYNFQTIMPLLVCF